MCFRRILSMVLAAAFLATTAACSTGSGDQAAATGNESLKSGSSKELTMYVMDYDTTTKNAIDKFNASHKEVQIKAKSLVAVPENNLGSRLMYELNSGAGPDIILCEEATLPNLSVFFGKGSFYDLNTVIKADKTFKQSDYFEKVMDYGAFKGKTYVMPLSFKVNALYTTKALLDEGGQGITINGGSLDEFVTASGKHIAAAAEKSNFFITDVDFASLLQTSSKSFIDIGGKIADFNSKAFGELMDKYKLLTQSTCPKSMLASPAERNNLLSGDKAVFMNLWSMGPRYAAEPYGSFKTEIEPAMIAAPYADSTPHVIAKPEKYIGINSKCGNVKAAFEFIKLMLSKEYQDSDMMEGIPVNREAYEQVKEKCLKGVSSYDYWKKGGCKKESTLKKLYSQLDKLIEGIDRCWTTDEYILTIVQKEVASYLNSNTTKENTLTAIQQQVENYLKSGIMAESLDKEDDTPSDPDKTVSLYYWDNSQCYVTNSEYLFSQKYKDITLKKKTFDSLEGFYKTTAVEIMAGGGPDVVLFDPRYFKSMDKTVQTGAFCEMDEYIKKLGIFNDDYDSELLKTGVYNGKRYYIPAYFYYTPLITTKHLLGEFNLDIQDGSWTWEKFAQYSKDFMKMNKGKGKYFLSIDFRLSRMLRNCDVPFVDYKNGKSNFNCGEFKKLLRLYKDINLSADTNADYFKNLVKSERNFIIQGTGMCEAIYFKLHCDDVASYTGSEMVVIPTPTFTGKIKQYAVPDDCIAVNSRCRNKEAAFNFVKIAVSYDMQRDYDSRGQCNAILATPINNKAYKDDMLSYASSGSFSVELANQMIKTHDELEMCLIKDYSILEMADELAADYIAGTKTEDQVAKELDDKVNVFLNE